LKPINRGNKTFSNGIDVFHLVTKSR